MESKENYLSQDEDLTTLTAYASGHVSECLDDFVTLAQGSRLDEASYTSAFDAMLDEVVRHVSVLGDYAAYEASFDDDDCDDVKTDDGGLCMTMSDLTLVRDAPLAKSRAKRRSARLAKRAAREAAKALILSQTAPSTVSDSDLSRNFRPDQPVGNYNNSDSDDYYYPPVRSANRSATSSATSAEEEWLCDDSAADLSVRTKESTQEELVDAMVEILKRVLKLKQPYANANAKQVLLKMHYCSAKDRAFAIGLRRHSELYTNAHVQFLPTMKKPPVPKADRTWEEVYALVNDDNYASFRQAYPERLDGLGYHPKFGGLGTDRLALAKLLNQYLWEHKCGAIDKCGYPIQVKSFNLHGRHCSDFWAGVKRWEMKTTKETGRMPSMVAIRVTMSSNAEYEAYKAAGLVLATGESFDELMMRADGNVIYGAYVGIAYLGVAPVQWADDGSLSDFEKKERFLALVSFAALAIPFFPSEERIKRNQSAFAALPIAERRILKEQLLLLGADMFLKGAPPPYLLAEARKLIPSDFSRKGCTSACEACSRKTAGASAEASRNARRHGRPTSATS